LLTGARGLVGAAVAAKLSVEGHEVIGLGRSASPWDRHVRSAVAVDIGEPGLVERVVREELRCDAIVHAAARKDTSLHAIEVSRTNCAGTHQMLELASVWSVVAFVFVSGVQVIGRPQRLPVTEQHPAAPRSAYHASKLYGEHLTAIAGSLGTPASVLRLTAPVGPGMAEARILPSFVRRALAGEPLEVVGRGTRRQDYVDVRDVAAAVAACLDRPGAGLLNIASGRTVSNLELARLCVEILESRSRVTLGARDDPEEGVSWEVSIERAADVLGYSPCHQLEDSILTFAESARAAEGG
jgi:UDP-glucose 4-epimerase